jgi:hypothetical protein
LADPGDNQRIIAQMVDKASALFDHAIKNRQVEELTDRIGVPLAGTSRNMGDARCALVFR